MVDGSVEYNIICSWKTLDLHVTTQCKLVKFEMLMLSFLCPTVLQVIPKGERHGMYKEPSLPPASAMKIRKNWKIFCTLKLLFILMWYFLLFVVFFCVQ